MWMFSHFQSLAGLWITGIKNSTTVDELAKSATLFDFKLTIQISLCVCVCACVYVCACMWECGFAYVCMHISGCCTWRNITYPLKHRGKFCHFTCSNPSMWVSEWKNGEVLQRVTQCVVQWDCWVDPLPTKSTRCSSSLNWGFGAQVA